MKFPASLSRRVEMVNDFRGVNALGLRLKLNPIGLDRMRIV
jgi:hypothetical protein